MDNPVDRIKRKELVKQLARIGKQLPELQKIGENPDYTYLRVSDVLRAVREKLFAAGIVILPIDVAEVRARDPYKTASGDMTREIDCKITYEITNGEASLFVESAGIGADYKGKALYMAETGALKALLKVLFLIAAEDDDPETVSDGPMEPGLAEKVDAAEAKFGPDSQQWPTSRRDAIAWNKVCELNGIGEVERQDFLELCYGTRNITTLTRRQIKDAFQWDRLRNDSAQAS